MLNNLKIKSKLLLLTGFTVVGLVALIFLNERTITKLVNLNEAKMSVEKLDISILELRKHEKDFLLRKDLKYLDKFNAVFKTMQEEVQTLEVFFANQTLETKELENFQTITSSYQSFFSKLVQTQQKIGLNPKDGLYGSLRESVHQVQEGAKNANDYKLLSVVYDLRKQEKDFMLRSDLKYVESFKKKIDALLETNVSEELLNHLKSYRSDFLALVESEVVLGLKSDVGIRGEMRKTVHQTEESIKKLIEDIDAHINSSIKNTEIMNITVSIAIILVIVAIVLLLSKNITNSLSQFQTGLLSFFRYLNKEEKEAHLIEINSKDEFGAMSTVVNDNIKKIQAGLLKDNEAVSEALSVVEQAIKGHLDVRLTKQANNPELKALSDALNKMLTGIKGNVDSISVVLKEFSNYKFVNKVDAKDLEGDMLELIKSVNFLTNEISDLLKTSLTIGLTLDDASDKLIYNVDVLNRSSNEAAASLEETAAALEEITSTIVNNSENVSKMSAYAKELNTSATTGQKLAQNTTTAMDDITEQVTLINEAISVIDQIAFQTNILSLNAAVEAATAGEAGKGFAVVAQEVRNLAARSAEAAKEIKELVENATQKAGHGKTISADMIEGYKGLLDNISKSTQMIEEIANASKEQEAGITQINDAVTQLDQQTQQNASIASQTHDIAVQTDTIAKEIVSDANSKEFLGKESAKVQKGTKEEPKKESKKESPKKEVKKEESKKKEEPKKVHSSHDDAVWEEF